MKLVLFGLGSIGQRYARILLDSYTHEVYAYRSSPDNPIEGLILKEIFSWKDVERIKPDVAFITNPTFLHIGTAMKCAELGCNLFIEKPLSHSNEGLDKLLRLVGDNHLTAYVAYNLRFHPIVQAMKDAVVTGRLRHMRVVCTSLLSQWRQGQDHMRSYSSHFNMGGGVLLDLSHEIDYSQYILGDISNLEGSFSHRSNLTHDVEDYADLIVTAQAGPANIHINFFSQMKQRTIQIDLEDRSLLGDLVTNRISEYKRESLVHEYGIECDRDYTYRKQLEFFFSNIINARMMNNVSEAADLLRKILAFRSRALQNA